MGPLIPALLVQRESDVQEISDLQVSLNAQSTGEPHVQRISICQDHTQVQEDLQSTSSS